MTLNLSGVVIIFGLVRVKTYARCKYCLICEHIPLEICRAGLGIVQTLRLSRCVPRTTATHYTKKSEFSFFTTPELKSFLTRNSTSPFKYEDTTNYYPITTATNTKQIQNAVPKITPTPSKEVTPAPEDGVQSIIAITFHSVDVVIFTTIGKHESIITVLGLQFRVQQPLDGFFGRNAGISSHHQTKEKYGGGRAGRRAHQLCQRARCSCRATTSSWTVARWY